MIVEKTATVIGMIADTSVEVHRRQPEKRTGMTAERSAGTTDDRDSLLPGRISGMIAGRAPEHHLARVSLHSNAKNAVRGLGRLFGEALPLCGRTPETTVVRVPGPRRHEASRRKHGGVHHLARSAADHHLATGAGRLQSQLLVRAALLKRRWQNGRSIVHGFLVVP